MNKKNLALILIAVLCNQTAYADEQSVSYLADEVVVTGTSFSEMEKESPRFITVVDNEQLVETGATNAIEALARIGGLFYKSGAAFGINSRGMTSSVGIRGIEGGELVLINGTPIQEGASKGYDLSTIPVEQIERIEVLKGTASTRYGADAMTGVVNIITKSPDDKTGIAVSGEFGNKDMMNHAVSLNFPDVTLGLHYQHIGAIDDMGRHFTSHYTYTLDETDRYEVNVNASLLKNVWVDYLYSQYETGLGYAYDAGFTPGSTSADNVDEIGYGHFLDLRYETDSAKVKLYGKYDTRDETEYRLGSIIQENVRDTYNYGAEANYRYRLADGIEITPGMDYVHRYVNYANDEKTKADFQYQKSRDDYGAFAELRVLVGDALVLTAAGREQFIDMPDARPDYDIFLPSSGLTWKASASTNLFANVGKAFRAPTFTQLYGSGSTFLANPDLRPESGWSYESGAKWDARNASVRLAAFTMRYEDKIEYRYVDKAIQYYNANNYKTTGVDWSLAISPFGGNPGLLGSVSLSANGYWAYPVAEDEDGIEYQPGPRFQNTFGAAYASNALAINFNCRMLTGREDSLRDYTAYDVSARVKAGPGNIMMAVDNLFDTEVQTMGELDADASSRYVRYEPGRLVRIGYSVKF